MHYNPLLPEVKANLYAHYAYLREHAPVYWVESLQAWAISRYDDVLYVLKNPHLFSSSVLFVQLLGEFDPVPEIPFMSATDPPAHLRLRKLANKGFMPSMIRNLTPRVSAIAMELLEPIRSKREFDFVREFSAAFPVSVIAEMLGIEPELRVDFKRWVDDLLIGASNRATATEEDRQRIRQSVNELRAYFEATIARRRQAPQDDLISAFIRAEEDNNALTSTEVLSLSILLLIGGSETTANLLASIIVTLLEQPDDFAKVRRDPSLIPQLIEEGLRYHSPVQALFRQTTQAVEIAGTTIPANATVMPLLASANRDARKFPNPDPERFDLTRNADGHVALGHGTHFCLGAPLARAEAKVALEALLQHLPPFRATEQHVTWIDSFFARGPKTLPLTFTTA